MAGSSLFTNLARAAKVVVLLLFFVPWVTVSCAPDAMQRMQAAERGAEAPGAPMMGGSAPAVVIARASGLNMAMGSLQMVDPTAGMAPTGGASAGARSAPPAPAPEVAVIAGAALLLIALIVSSLKGAVGAVAAAGSSLLALAAFCYSVFVHYPPEVIAAFVASRPDANADQVGQILSVQPDTLFYLVILLLGLAIVFNVLAMRRPAAAAAPASATPPPPAEPPAAT